MFCASFDVVMTFSLDCVGWMCACEREIRVVRLKLLFGVSHGFERALLEIKLRCTSCSVSVL